ncbi:MULTISPECIES: hypothetical protein [Nocardia]|uniref:Uncharacterized protein n=1 Tax=Nocardia nova TaxID=37330 RepID=A0A2T2Z4X0_9NOCA|nr:MULTISPECIES: hypothetical protein [Nocardia]PSR62803.1 hypothetical protein C8259_13595 [Nocardia nova]
MTDDNPNNVAAQAKAMSERVRALTARAESAGYTLVRSAAPRYEWTLLDGEYRENIFSTTDLDRIEQWLDT